MRHLAQFFAISNKHIGARDISQIFPFVQHHDIVLSGIVEQTSDGFHRVIGFDAVGRIDHDIVHQSAILIAIEHDVSDVIEQDMAFENTLIIHNRKDVSFG